MVKVTACLTGCVCLVESCLDGLLNWLGDLGDELWRLQKDVFWWCLRHPGQTLAIWFAGSILAITMGHRVNGLWCLPLLLVLAGTYLKYRQH